MKRLVRCGLAAGCVATGVLSLAERRARQALTILCYHRVLPAAEKARYFIPDMVVTPAALAAHCELLRARFEVRTLSAALARWPQRNGDQRPLAVITFDDGYQDNCQFAAPVLQEFGLPATFFIITALAGTRALPWYDRLARAAAAWRARGGTPANGHGLAPLLGRLAADVADANAFARAVVSAAKRLPPEERARLLDHFERSGTPAAPPPTDQLMTWAQIAALARAGHEIGSHTRTHPILTQLDDAALRSELAGSRAELAARLGVPPRSVAYPNGDADERVTRAARAAGYTAGVTLDPGNNPPGCGALRLTRHFMHEERLAGLSGGPSPNVLRLQLAGLADQLLARALRARGA
ncbi:MAG: polysaccharide deacetylase family protein [Planctomycetota bacterium]